MSIIDSTNLLREWAALTPPTGGSAGNASANNASAYAAAQAAVAEQAAAAVSAAASELSHVLATTESLNPRSAQSVVGAVSGLLEVQAFSQGSASSDEAAVQIGNAVDQLVRATASGLGSSNSSETIALSSPNLNMSIAVRPPSALASTPMSCDSTLGEASVVVHMPTGLLDTVPGIDLSEPVSVVLHTAAVNLHAPPMATRGLRRLSEDGSSVSTGQASPVVTFKLLRPNGDEIEIKNALTPIEISLPYRVNSVNNSRPPCIGEPTLEPTIEVRGGLVDVASSWSCDTIVQCRFWNETEGFWSTEGCRTIVNAEGGVGCSCNHLTEFIAFEFPLTVEELLDTILESVTINTMSISAVQCALNPRIDKDPVVWCLVMLLIVALVSSLVNAVRRDRAEIAVTELLVKGRKLEAQRKALNSISQVVGRKKTKTTKSGQEIQHVLLRASSRGDLTFIAASDTHGRAATCSSWIAASDATGRRKSVSPAQGSKPKSLAALRSSAVFGIKQEKQPQQQDATRRRNSVSPAQGSKWKSLAALRSSAIFGIKHEQPLPSKIGGPHDRAGHPSPPPSPPMSSILSTGPPRVAPRVAPNLGRPMNPAEAVHFAQGKGATHKATGFKVVAGKAENAKAATDAMSKIAAAPAVAGGSSARDKDKTVADTTTNWAAGSDAARQQRRWWRLGWTALAAKAFGQSSTPRGPAAAPADEAASATATADGASLATAPLFGATQETFVEAFKPAEEVSIDEIDEEAGGAVPRARPRRLTTSLDEPPLEMARHERTSLDEQPAELTRSLERKRSLRDVILNREQGNLQRVSFDVGPRAVPAPLTRSLIELGRQERVTFDIGPRAVLTKQQRVKIAVRHERKRKEKDVLGIFGNRGQAVDTGSGQTPRVSAAHRWSQAKLEAQKELLATRWRKDVDRSYKRIWLAFKGSHSLLSGLVYRGTSGTTRAMTVMVLFNSINLELVTLCMFYSGPTNGEPMVINPVGIVFSASIAAAICIPAMLTLGWLFEPEVLARVPIRLLTLLFGWPLLKLYRLIVPDKSGETTKVEEAVPPDGLAWERIGSTPPTTGRCYELRNAQLSFALQRRTWFYEADLRSFGLLRVNQKCFIKAGDHYFRPKFEFSVSAGGRKLTRSDRIVLSLPGSSFSDALHVSSMASVGLAPCTRDPTVDAVGSSEQGLRSIREADVMEELDARPGAQLATETLTKPMDPGPELEARPTATVHLPVVLEAFKGEGLEAEDSSVSSRKDSSVSSRKDSSVSSRKDSSVSSRKDSSGVGLEAEDRTAGAIKRNQAAGVMSPLELGSSEQAVDEPPSHPSGDAVQPSGDGLFLGRARLRGAMSKVCAVNRVSALAEASAAKKAAEEQVLEAQRKLEELRKRCSARACQVGGVKLSCGALPDCVDTQARCLGARGGVKLSCAPAMPEETCVESGVSLSAASPPPSPPEEGSERKRERPRVRIRCGHSALMRDRTAKKRNDTSKDGSKLRLKSLLQQAATGNRPVKDRKFSYASLDDWMLTQSLTRSVSLRHWADVRRILFGWVASLVVWFGLLITFIFYACELFVGGGMWQQLIFAWIFCVFQRFVVNEPVLILAAKGLPILFASEFFANFCGETIVNLLDLSIQGITACFAFMTKP